MCNVTEGPLVAIEKTAKAKDIQPFVVITTSHNDKPVMDDKSRI
jgi:hypothetical protein